MARATTCTLHNREIDIDEALRLRDQSQRNGGSYPDFHCVECDMPVRPHSESDYGEAHFEHWSRNPNCRLSDTGR